MTSVAKEEDKFGKILSVKVRCFGVFTTMEGAHEVAERHHGQATHLSTDHDEMALLAMWENPGFADRY